MPNLRQFAQGALLHFVFGLNGPPLGGYQWQVSMLLSKRAFFFAYSLGAALSLSSSVAWADDLDLTILRTTSAAEALDSAALRSALETELHSVIIPPSDARSSSAKGTLTIDVDRKRWVLVVTYLANAKPLTRTISLPVEESTAERTIVLLAGNLARDEGSDLAAQLRKRPGSEPRAEAQALEKPPIPPVSPVLGGAESERDASRLQSTLDYYADNERKTRKALGYAFAAAGTAAAGLTVYGGVRSKDTGVWLGGGLVASSLLSIGIAGLVLPGPFEDLAGYTHRVGKGSPQYAEQAWVRAAGREHRAKRAAGIIGVVASGATVGVSTWLLLDSHSASDASQHYGPAVTLMGLGVVEGALSVYWLASEGPIETALHGYERSSGRTLRSTSAILPHVQVGMTSSGFFAAMSGTF